MSFSFPDWHPESTAPAAVMPLSCKKVLRFIRAPSNMACPTIYTGLMLSMTVQAPPHLETGEPGDPAHGGHLAVADRAGKVDVDMNHVREIDMIRQPVDPDPGDWLPLFPVPHQLLDFRSVRGDEQVAGPTVGHGRETGNRRLRRIAMAEEAMDAVVAGMHLMAEGERLDRRTIPKIQRQTVE